MVEFVCFGGGHDGLEFLDDLAGGIDVVAAAVEVGLEVVIEREVDVLEVEGLFLLGFVGLELLEAGLDGFDGAKAVRGAAVGHAAAVGDLLGEVVDVLVNGDALLFFLHFLRFLLSALFVFFDGGVEDGVDGLLHLFLCGSDVAIEHGVEGEFEPVEFGPEFRVLVLVCGHGLGTAFGFVPGFDIHFKAG